MKPTDQRYFDEYVKLIKRESALTALLNVHNGVSVCGDLTASDKSNFHKIISAVYRGMKIEKE